MKRLRPSQVLNYCRTNWRGVLAYLLLAASMALALALGVTTTIKQGKTNNRIVALGTPCVELEKGEHKGEPSQGCERLARLLNEVCLRTPKLCPPVSLSTLDPRTMKGLTRLLNSDVLQRQLRRELQGQIPKGERRDGGPLGSVPGTGQKPPSSGRSPSPPSPSKPAPGQPPAPGAPPGAPLPPSPGDRPLQRVQETLDRTLDTPPRRLIEEPVPTLKHLTEPLLSPPPGS